MSYESGMTTRITVSLPDRLLLALDSARGPQKLGRSAAVQRAIDQWTRGGTSLDLDYIDAYRRLPERADELDAWARAAAEAWGRPAPKRSRRAAR